MCYLKASNSRALLPPKARAAESRGKAGGADRSWGLQLRKAANRHEHRGIAARRHLDLIPHSPFRPPAELPLLTGSWGPGVFFPAYTGQPPRAQKKVKWEERVWEGRQWYQTSRLTHQSLHDTPKYRDRFVPPLPKPSQMPVNPKTTVSRGSKGDTESV